MQDELGDASEEVRVFVYGTLKPGEENYEYYCKNHCNVEEAMVLGQLYDLPFGYPALTVGNSPVYGFLLSFADSSILAKLDELEDYDPVRKLEQNEYFRVKIPVLSLANQPLGWAWTYCMRRTQIQQFGGALLPEGKWSSQKSYFRT